MITKVPHLPSYIKGIINLRGKVIPVIDLGKKFYSRKTKYKNRACIVVVNIKEDTIGLIVDSVSGVINITREEIDPPPQMESSIQSQFIDGMGKTQDEVYILLDVKQLIYKRELEELE